MFFTVECKSELEKGQKFGGNLVRIFSVVFSVKEFAKHTTIVTATTLPFPLQT